MLYTLLLILLVVTVLGTPYSGWHSYGWYPSGGAGIIVLVLIVLLLMGRI